jgi:hypothetical protein
MQIAVVRARSGAAVAGHRIAQCLLLAPRSGGLSGGCKPAVGAVRGQGSDRSRYAVIRKSGGGLGLERESGHDHVVTALSPIHQAGADQAAGQQDELILNLRD